MAVQLILCQTWSETMKTGFLVRQLKFDLMRSAVLFEPHPENSCFCHYASKKGADQPVHQNSLISTSAVYCLESIKAPVSKGSSKEQIGYDCKVPRFSDARNHCCLQSS